MNDHPDVHPWLRQFREDIDVLLAHPMAADLRSIWDPPIVTRLFHDPTISERFRYYDMRELRSTFVSQEWAPPEALPITTHLPPPVSIPVDSDDEELLYVCGLGGCEQRFATAHKLVTHQVHSKAPGHGWPPILTTLTVDNKCLMCNTVFQNMEHTIRHHRRSWLQGRCLPDQTRHVYTYVPAGVRMCPYSAVSKNPQCCIEANSLESLRAHLRLHVPLSPSGSAWKQPDTPTTRGPTS
eukprot:3094006-Pyramimonas_sp.AAC.1